MLDGDGRRIRRSNNMNGLSKKTYVSLFSLLVFASGQVCATTLAEQLGFEVVEDVWVTEADMSEFAVNKLWCEHVTTGSYAQLRNGVSRSTLHVKQGLYSCKWEKHNEFPTLGTDFITQQDFSPYNIINFWAYSETATSEWIYLTLHSDDVSTAWKDFYFSSFKVDWVGWKRVSIPFSDFDQYGQPVGISQINGIYLYTKAFNKQPNPYTVLYLDDVELMNTEDLKAHLTIVNNTETVIISSDELEASGFYILQVTENLSGSWSNLTTVTGTTSTNWVISPLSATESFYRIQAHF